MGLQRTADLQNWILLGTAEASKTVWGLDRIDFPSGYNIPGGSFAGEGEGLQPGNPGGDYWVMGGFALEIGREGKKIAADQVAAHVRGYRPWLGVFHHAVLAELEEKRHTIEIWDQGVSIFYGLWREATSALGDLITPEAYHALIDNPTELQLTRDGQASGQTTGEAPSAYVHDAQSVLPFMSDFMTLSEGDIYVLGPLVAVQTSGAQEAHFTAGDVSFGSTLV